MNEQESLSRRSKVTQLDAMTEVVVAGHICLDIIPTLTGDAPLLAPGRLVEAGPAVLSTGGAVSNTGLALHKLGVATRLMGKVGTDLFGQAIRELVGSYGPELAKEMIVVPGEVSSYSVILSSPSLDRILIHAPGCNSTFTAGDVRYQDLEAVRIFHFGYPPLMERMYADTTELATMFRRVKAPGVTTSLDMCMPDPNSAAGRADWYAILGSALPYVDIFLPSLEELLLMLRPGRSHGFSPQHLNPEIATELADMLLGMGAKIIGLKAGHHGLYLRTGSANALAQMGRAKPTSLDVWADRELWAPCFEARVVGTTGSGDATIAGFLMGLLRGMTPEETLSTACAVGACSVEAADALSGIRSWGETAARMATGWPRLPLTLNSPGWHWDNEHEVWVGPMDARHYGD